MATIQTSSVGILTVRRENADAREAMQDWDERFREHLIAQGLLTPAKLTGSTRRIDERRSVEPIMIGHGGT